MKFSKMAEFTSLKATDIHKLAKEKSLPLLETTIVKIGKRLYSNGEDIVRIQLTKTQDGSNNNSSPDASVIKGVVAYGSGGGGSGVDIAWSNYRKDDWDESLEVGDTFPDIKIQRTCTIKAPHSGSQQRNGFYYETKIVLNDESTFVFIDDEGSESTTNNYSELVILRQAARDAGKVINLEENGVPSVE